MAFGLTAEHEMVRKVIREFAQKEVKPTIKDWDCKQDIAPDILPRMAELGILGICVPVCCRGQGMD